MLIDLDVIVRCSFPYNTILSVKALENPLVVAIILKLTYLSLGCVLGTRVYVESL